MTCSEGLWSCRILSLELWVPELWENKFHHSSHLVEGSLFMVLRLQFLKVWWGCRVHFQNSWWLEDWDSPLRACPRDFAGHSQLCTCDPETMMSFSNASSLLITHGFTILCSVDGSHKGRLTCKVGGIVFHLIKIEVLTNVWVYIQNQWDSAGSFCQSTVQRWLEPSSPAMDRLGQEQGTPVFWASWIPGKEDWLNYWRRKTREFKTSYNFYLT